MNSKNLLIICICVIAVVIASAMFVVFYKSSQLTIMTGENLEKGDDFKALLSSDGVGLADQKVKIILTDENGEENEMDFQTDDEGIVSFSTTGTEPGKYSIRVVFDGNSAYGSASTEGYLTVEEGVKEVSSTSAESGWAFDAPEGWHWKRTPPGETWLIKDDGTGDKLYYGSELVLEHRNVNGKSVTVYEKEIYR